MTQRSKRANLPGLDECAAAVELPADFPLDVPPVRDHLIDLYIDDLYIDRTDGMDDSVTARDWVWMAPTQARALADVVVAASRWASDASAALANRPRSLDAIDDLIESGAKIPLAMAARSELEGAAAAMRYERRVDELVRAAGGEGDGAVDGADRATACAEGAASSGVDRAEGALTLAVLTRALADGARLDLTPPTAEKYRTIAELHSKASTWIEDATVALRRPATLECLRGLVARAEADGLARKVELPQLQALISRVGAAETWHEAHAELLADTPKRVEVRALESDACTQQQQHSPQQQQHTPQQPHPPTPLACHV